MKESYVLIKNHIPTNTEQLVSSFSKLERAEIVLDKLAAKEASTEYNYYIETIPYELRVEVA